MLDIQEKQEIEEASLKFLNENNYDFDKMVPVNVVEYAKACGFYVGLANLPPSTEGFIVINNPKNLRLIGVNKDCRIDKIGFVIAHELGHFCNDYKDEIFYLHQEIDSCCNKSYNDEKADFFAATLLMPTDVFQKIYGIFSQIYHDESSLIDNLANYFQVPNESVILRKYEVGLHE